MSASTKRQRENTDNGSIRDAPASKRRVLSTTTTTNDDITRQLVDYQSKCAELTKRLLMRISDREETIQRLKDEKDGLKREMEGVKASLSNDLKLCRTQITAQETRNSVLDKMLAETHTLVKKHEQTITSLQHQAKTNNVPAKAATSLRSQEVPERRVEVALAAGSNSRGTEVIPTLSKSSRHARRPLKPSSPQHMGLTKLSKGDTHAGLDMSNLLGYSRPLLRRNLRQKSSSMLIQGLSTHWRQIGDAVIGTWPATLTVPGCINPNATSMIWRPGAPSLASPSMDLNPILPPGPSASPSTSHAARPPACPTDQSTDKLEETMRVLERLKADVEDLKLKYRDSHI